LIAALSLLLGACASGPAIDGNLDCPTDGTWIGASSEESDDSPESNNLLTQALSPYRLRRGGEVTVLDRATASLAVDGREVVVVEARWDPQAGWVIAHTTGCEEFTG